MSILSTSVTNKYPFLVSLYISWPGFRNFRISYTGVSPKISFRQMTEKFLSFFYCHEYLFLSLEKLPGEKWYWRGHGICWALKETAVAAFLLWYITSSAGSTKMTTVKYRHLAVIKCNVYCSHNSRSVTICFPGDFQWSHQTGVKYITRRWAWKCSHRFFVIFFS